MSQGFLTLLVWRCHPDLNRGITVLQTVVYTLLSLDFIDIFRIFVVVRGTMEGSIIFLYYFFCASIFVKNLCFRLNYILSRSFVNRIYQAKFGKKIEKKLNASSLLLVMYLYSYFCFGLSTFQAPSFLRITLYQS